LLPVGSFAYLPTQCNKQPRRLKSEPTFEETAGILGTICMYRETSFFSTRETSKGGDNRARARSM
jgi:hypothetical protein